MTILTFLGTVDIADNDDYGKIHLKLAFDLLRSVNLGCDRKVVEEKACNIIQVCCEPMFDDLIDLYNWDREETSYVDGILASSINWATADLLELVNRRITHQQKHERRTKLRIEDLKVSRIMAFVLNVPKNISGQLEATFHEAHGGMYFK
jgi:hypothetical protein